MIAIKQIFNAHHKGKINSEKQQVLPASGLNREIHTTMKKNKYLTYYYVI